MQHKRTMQILLHLLLGILVLSACTTFAPPAIPTDTPQPTATVTKTATITPSPTSTPRPTKTPNLVATQRYDAMYDHVLEFVEKGYLDSTDGHYFELDDFSASLAQINYYQKYSMRKTASSFIFAAHFKWSTATKTPDISGCGVVFGLQPNNDHFAVFLDKSILRFLQSDSGRNKRYGKTSGTDSYKFENPDEADFMLAVSQSNAYVFVDDYDVVVYTLPQNVVVRGELAYSLRSGTNKDYGTRCEMTDVRLWIAD